METKLNTIRQIVKSSKENKVENILYLVNEENLKECFYELKRGSAVGVDGITFREYEKNLDENISKLVESMKKWQYRPQPLRRVMIEKENGKQRPLGIPTIEDKMVQKCVCKILEAIYEIDFLDLSYGFRPNRNCHQAVNTLDKMIMRNKTNYVIDADIEGYFNNIDHKWLRKCLEVRIKDQQFLRLMVRLFKGKIIEESGYIDAEEGVPQGAVLSPILANIYLHYILDLWFEKLLKKKCKGYVGLVRYADDFVICAEREDEAKMILKLLNERFAKFDLKLSAEKTKIVKFGRNSGKNGGTFNFLGFTFYNAKTRWGGYKVGIKTRKERLRRSIGKMKYWLKKMRNRKVDRSWWNILCSKVRGHNQYYGISGNSRALGKYLDKVKSLLWKWLNRRSQRKSMTVKEFREYLKRFPMPKMKIKHFLYG